MQPHLEKRNPDTDGHYRWTELIEEAFDELVYHLRVGLAYAAESRELRPREDVPHTLVSGDGQVANATVASAVVWAAFHAIAVYRADDGVELPVAQVERQHAVLAALAPFALGRAVEQVLAERTP